MPTASSGATAGSSGELVRAIDWKGAFWAASGVPALLLFSIGGVAGRTGTVAFAVWILSMVMGFIQAFTYAEIASLFSNKSGGASIHGATAWLRYGKLIAPISVGCNWLAWSPILSLGCSIAASTILDAIAPIPVLAASSPEVAAFLADPTNAGRTAADAITALTVAATPAIRSWSLLSAAIPGFANLSINATFLIGAALMLVLYAIQRRGILSIAGVQKWIGLAVIVPMLIVGVVPFLTGSVDTANFSPFVPPAAAFSAEPGTWSNAGWTLVLGAMFLAAWSTYGFETAICYTSELRDPARDTFRAIIFSGLLCLVIFTLVPLAFQGALGIAGMLAAPVVDGSGVAAAMARMVAQGNHLIERIFVMLMILALVLAIMTAMAGSARTLYQGSIDGWLPRYLGRVNSHGAPTRAMSTDLAVNLALLAIASSDSASYFTILAISNCGYIICWFLNLNAGWIHRIDSGHLPRHYRAPTALLALGTVCSFMNLFFMGAGAKVWNPNALLHGFIAAALVIPVFLYRHYVQDGGRLPDHMLADLGLEGQDLGERKAGILPYLTLAAGIAVVLIADHLFQL